MARGREVDHSPGNSRHGRPNTASSRNFGSRPQPWPSLRGLNGFGLAARRDLTSFDRRSRAADLFLRRRLLGCRWRFLKLKLFSRRGLGRGSFLVGGNFAVNDGQLDFKT